MKIGKLNGIVLIFLGLYFSSCTAQERTKKQEAIAQKYPTETATKTASTKTKIESLQLPPVNREFRAAWIATVANINWPSRNNLSVDQQKLEAIAILDRLKEANFNAVIFQARPSADAFYKSDLEPWSYFLTGTLGKDPSYDPLEFWITETHKRGMEFHAWINPYRAHHTNGGSVTDKSMVKKMANETYRLRNGMYWMDPSDEKVQNHVAAVIKDLVKRYDLDAIHIDDYFYPYKEYNGGKEFPDSKTWTNYLNSGGNLTKADWRRANVNKFIKRIHEEIKAEKSYVKFGISPFGIWKDKFPEDVTGTSQYDELFADAKLWLNEGWCDYFAPQLYWKEESGQRFSSLLKWWNQENYKKINLWPGLNTIAVKGVADRPTEIAHQIETTRSILKENSGQIHYSVDGIVKNPAMFEMLKNIYKEKALVPANSWIKIEPITKPELNYKKIGTEVSIAWTSKKQDKVRHWILYSKYGENWEIEILDQPISSKNISIYKSDQKLKIVALKAVDRLGNESDYTAIFIKE